MSNIALILAGAVAAQAPGQVWTWLVDVEHAELDPSKGITTQTVTLTALMEYDAPAVYIAGTIFDTVGVLNAEFGQITDWDVLNHLDEATGDLTTSDGVSLYGTNAGQVCATFGPCDMSNPIGVLEFTWELDEDLKFDSPFEVSYATFTETAVMFAGDNQDDAQAYEARILFEGVASWTVVPAPSVVAAFAGVPLLARRRRRNIQLVETS